MVIAAHADIDEGMPDSTVFGGTASRALASGSH